MKTDLQAEERLISIVLANPSYDDINPTALRPNYFSDVQTNIIWDLIVRTIEERKQPPTPANVYAMAVLTNVSDMITMAVLNEYMGMDVPVMLWKDYSERVISTYRQRATLDALYAAANGIEHGDDADIDETIDRMSDAIYRIQTQTEDTETDRKDAITAQVLEQLFSPAQSIIKTPYPALDTVVGGLSEEELIILAARPGMGKTSFAVSAMVELAIMGTPVAFFSLDMGRNQIWRRFLSYLSGISIQRFKEHGTGDRPFDIMESGYIRDAREQYLKLPVYVDASSVYTVKAIKNRIRALALKGVRVVFIDHIGKVSADKRFGRTEEVGIIARELKRFAKEHEIVLVVLSQLNRGVEYRGKDDGSSHKRPMLADLRDSGDIEQEADMVWMLYRPEYYKLTTWEDGSPCGAQLEIQVEKNRDGAPDRVRLRYEAWRGAVTSFT